MKYEPHRYVNRITKRKDSYRYHSIFREGSHSYERDIADHPIFDTWEEAHEQLMRWRHEEVDKCESAWRKALRSLANAKRMKNEN
jgi:hypothetical protein